MLQSGTVNKWLRDFTQKPPSYGQVKCVEILIGGLNDLRGNGDYHFVDLRLLGQSNDYNHVIIWMWLELWLCVLWIQSILLVRLMRFMATFVQQRNNFLHVWVKY